MGHGDGRRKDSAGKTVRDIRRAARRRFASLDRPLLAPVTAGIVLERNAANFAVDNASRP